MKCTLESRSEIDLKKRKIKKSLDDKMENSPKSQKVKASKSEILICILKNLRRDLQKSSLSWKSTPQY